jgi:hypothetical protein
MILLDCLIKDVSLGCKYSSDMNKRQRNVFQWPDLNVMFHDDRFTGHIISRQEEHNEHNDHRYVRCLLIPFGNQSCNIAFLVYSVYVEPVPSQTGLTAQLTDSFADLSLFWGHNWDSLTGTDPSHLRQIWWRNWDFFKYLNLSRYTQSWRHKWDSFIDFNLSRQIQTWRHKWESLTNINRFYCKQILTI